MMCFEIVPVQPEQLDGVSMLYVASWQRTYRGLLPDTQLDAMTVPSCREKWAHYITMPGHTLLCARAEDVLLGFAACCPCRNPAGCMLLDSLHVDPAFGGRGVGRALIAHCGRLARELGCSEMAVYVVKGNRRAHELYLRLGARPLFEFNDPVDGAPSWALAWEDLSVF